VIVIVVVDKASVGGEDRGVGGQILRDCERKRNLVSKISIAFPNTERGMYRS